MRSICGPSETPVSSSVRDLYLLTWARALWVSLQFSPYLRRRSSSPLRRNFCPGRSYSVLTSRVERVTQRKPILPSCCSRAFKSGTRNLISISCGADMKVSVNQNEQQRVWEKILNGDPEFTETLKETKTLCPPCLRGEL